MMTPRRSSDDDSPLNGSVWKGFPVWLRAGLIFGPLGVVFLGVCFGAYQLWGDVRVGLKEWMTTQKIALTSASESIETMTRLSVEADARSREFCAQVRAEHSAMQRVVEATADTSQQTVKLMMDAKDMMRDAPKQRQDLVEQGKEHTIILESIRDELKRKPPSTTSIN
jgi:hypothetical protein